MGTTQLVKLYRKSSGVCHYCLTETHLKRGPGGFQKPNTATKEHVVPRSLGGKDIMSNYVLACSACNNRRGIILFFCRCSGCKEKIYTFLDEQSNVDKMFWRIVTGNKPRITRDADGMWRVWRAGYKHRRFDTWQHAMNFVSIVYAPQIQEI